MPAARTRSRLDSRAPSSGRTPARAERNVPDEPMAWTSAHGTRRRARLAATFSAEAASTPNACAIAAMVASSNRSSHQRASTRCSPALIRAGKRHRGQSPRRVSLTALRAVRALSHRTSPQLGQAICRGASVERTATDPGHTPVCCWANAVGYRDRRCSTQPGLRKRTCMWFSWFGYGVTTARGPRRSVT